MVAAPATYIRPSTVFLNLSIHEGIKVTQDSNSLSLSLAQIALQGYKLSITMAKLASHQISQSCL